ncbi:MAG: TIGR04282 family arsenosugar biosynthesis glycosyltransferase [Magnetovibrio sp.]|nr:TIGR04282 family arsenosugar biosynthesis glycosyltransferase [Magnetovibrio sp.]
MSGPQSRHLVLMSKAPRIGRVKTRLAREIGFVKAWNFHRRNLFATAHNLNRPGWTCWLSVSPDQARLQPRQWPKFWHLIAQGGGDLGQRMLRQWQHLPPGPVVMIGSDIPNIQAQDIQAAFKTLQHNDFVFGPCPDGGYWLVGAKRRPTVFDPFQGVRWSSEHALADTIANLAKGSSKGSSKGRSKGSSVGFVKELSDVDEAKDLKMLFQARH